MRIYPWLLLLLLATNASAQTKNPRIVNIVNFIRLLEPRDSAITQDVLFQTVVNQVELMKKYHLKGSFLLQYDALMDKRYQALLKSLPADQFEIGGWWEIPQPLVEKAGMHWRGRYPWDWHADVGFSTGYTPAEREKLVDVYMADFKALFGYYPQSMASWFIDEHSLQYMYDKYQIVASANCKDQYGTDGYTLWGGYWNQAYYPSRKNAFMPAQHEDQQIPVPVFRMLGSDPVRQYDFSLGNNRQGVVTLEPVYPEAGGSEAWINWFLDELVNGASMAFAYTQAGQENSFTWPAMAKGLELQFPRIAALRDSQRVEVQTLAESGKWFREQFKTTPPTAVTVNKDLGSSDKKTTWFNSRFYRVNLLWEKGSLRFRDIHLFDEGLASLYLDKPVTSNECYFFSLPVVDGYLWTTNANDMAGLWWVDDKGNTVKGGDPVISDHKAGELTIDWPVEKGKVRMTLTERTLSIEQSGKPMQLLLKAAKEDQLPFTEVQGKTIKAIFQQRPYAISLKKGKAQMLKGTRRFMVIPENGKIEFDFSRGF